MIRPCSIQIMRVRSSTGARVVLAGLALCLVGLGAGAARAQVRVIVRPDVAVEFSRLPAGFRVPEGITRDPVTQKVFVSNAATPGALFRIDPSGAITAQRDMGATIVAGLIFNPRDGKLYVAAGGMLGSGTPATIQRIPADFTRHLQALCWLWRGRPGAGGVGNAPPPHRPHYFNLDSEISRPPRVAARVPRAARDEKP